MSELRPTSNEVQIDYLFYVSVSGKTYDLLGDFLDFQISESIFNSFMNGYIKIVDMNALSEEYQMYSGGYINMQFKTNEAFRPITQVFWVYKVGNDNLNSGAQYQWVNRTLHLYFTSMEMRYEIYERYSKYYKDVYWHEVVSDVCSTLLKSNLAVKDDTKDKTSFPTPYTWSPTGIIDYCKKNSFSKKMEDVGYTFFKNTYKGFYFVSYSYLLSQKYEEKLYFISPDGLLDRKTTPPSFLYIQDYRTLTNVDYLQGYLGKRFGGSMHTFSFNKKNWKEIKFVNNTEYLNSTYTLGRRSLEEIFFANAEAYHYAYFGSSPDYQMPQLARRSLLENNILELQMAGSSERYAGRIFRFEYLHKDHGKDYNDYLQGNWIMLNVIHNVNNKKQYQQTLVVGKDTMYNKGLNVWPILTKVNAG
jgi:hypothetical protein